MTSPVAARLLQGPGAERLLDVVLAVAAFVGVFIEAAIVAGHIAESVPAGWTPPRREMIDPTKETAAAKEQVRCGFISRSEVVRQNGFDPDQVLDEIAEDNRKADAKKLRFDTDARTAPPQKQEAAAG
mgnify:CR=1 FL=1